MGGRLLLLHWELAEADGLADDLRGRGFQVEVEAEDGGRAARRVRENTPDALVIGLDRKPAHGRETARVLREQRATRDLPMVFFGGDPATVADVRRSVPDATHVPWAAVPTVIEGILRHRVTHGDE